MIYFDSAATTLQKPYTVVQAVSTALTSLASPGRGGYPAAAPRRKSLFSGGL